MQENVLLGFAPLVSGRVTMGARRIFSRGGQIRGLETKVCQPGPSGSGAKLPKADEKL